MNDINTIKLGYGLGGLRFGSTREECRNYLGDPEEETTENLGDEEYIIWNYWSKGISVCFEEAEDYKLGTFILEHKNGILSGEHIIGKTVKEIERYLKDNSFFYLSEVNAENPVSKLIEVDAIECNFLFTNEILDGIQWSYFWNEDEDAPSWPEN